MPFNISSDAGRVGCFSWSNQMRYYTFNDLTFGGRPCEMRECHGYAMVSFGDRSYLIDPIVWFTDILARFWGCDRLDDDYDPDDELLEWEYD